MEELYLLLEIYQAQSLNREALAVLNTPSLGPKSRIAQGESSVLLAQAKLIEKTNLWQEAIPFCQNLLGTGGPTSVHIGSGNKSTVEYYNAVDDWEIWKLLVNATNQIGTKEYGTPSPNTPNSSIGY